ncbi:MAG: hypothetical protein HZC24_16880 [Rhodocyclales bacterium]|nr:hypothetical protein [Rhodocyclales bacterium]
MRGEEREPPEESGSPSLLDRLQSRADRLAAALVLKPLDGVIGLLQHIRNRIEPPADAEEDRRDNRHRARSVVAETAAAPARPSRLRGMLFLLLALIGGAFAGMVFSFGLLSKIIDSKDLVIDDMQEEIKQLNKEERHSLNVRAKLQERVDEGARKLGEYQAAIEDCRSRADDLKGKLDALNQQLNAQAVDARRSGQPSAPRRAAGISSRNAPQVKPPEKTGTCVTGTTDAAANLTRCVQDFNRR